MIFDVQDMLHKFGQSTDKMTDYQREAFLQFRIAFMQEEINEMKSADCPEDVVDAIIDLMYVAIGTLELFKVDTQLAWDTVHDANMAKIPGFNENRPNEFGFPDLIKPAGWKPPCHKGNTGRL